MKFRWICRINRYLDTENIVVNLCWWVETRFLLWFSLDFCFLFCFVEGCKQSQSTQFKLLGSRAISTKDLVEDRDMQGHTRIMNPDSYPYKYVIKFLRKMPKSFNKESSGGNRVGGKIPTRKTHFSFPSILLKEQQRTC